MQLFLTFLKIGLFSIGGGYAIIPVIQEQVVHQQGWLSEKVFSDIITISQINGISGAIVATIGCILGGCVISISLYQFFQKHNDSLYVAAALKSLKASSVGLIMSAGFTILLLAFFETSDFSSNLLLQFDWRAAILFTASLIILRKFKPNPIVLMCVAGLAGFFLYQ